MDIAIGTQVTIAKGLTQITGRIDGIKANENGLERISIMELDHWFWMLSGWVFVDVMEEENG